MGTPCDFLIDFAAGGVSNAVAKTITAPIAYYQLLDQPPLLELQQSPINPSFWDLWAGNTLNVLCYFPNHAFNLIIKDIKRHFPNQYNHRTDFWKWIAAQVSSTVVAGTLALAIAYPWEVLRRRQVFATVSPVVARSLHTCYLPDGRSCGLWKWNLLSIYSVFSGGADISGFWSSLLGIVAYRGSYFALGPAVARAITSLGPQCEEFGLVAILKKFAVAQATISVVQLIAYPFGTISQAIQLQACV